MDAKHVGTMLLLDEIADGIDKPVGYIMDYMGVRSCSGIQNTYDMLIVSYYVNPYGHSPVFRLEVYFYDFCVEGYSLAGLGINEIKPYLNQEVAKQLGMSDMKMAVYRERFK